MWNFLFVVCLGVQASAGVSDNQALHEIIRSGHSSSLLSYLESLPSRSPSLHSEDSEGFTPLRLAAHLHRVELFDPLVRVAGADPNQRSVGDGWTALHTAIRSASPTLSQSTSSTSVHEEQVQIGRKMVKELHRLGADINLANVDGDTPLMMACLEGLHEIVSDLLELGADHKRSSLFDRYTAVHAAARHNSKESIRHLVRAGADVNARSMDGDTPLMLAVVYQSVDAVKELVSLGTKVDLNKVREDGSTAAEMAAALGDREIALLLARAGADLDKKNVYERSPRQVAADHGHDGLFDEEHEL